MSIKTRIEIIEKKVRPKPRLRPFRLLYEFGDKKLSVKELKKSMRSFRFNFEDPAIAKDQAAKPDPQPEQEPDDNELEAEVERLEAKKAALLDKGKKHEHF
jgi:uncharacterized protein YktB (UPF0637 family)